MHFSAWKRLLIKKNVNLGMISARHTTNRQSFKKVFCPFNSTQHTYCLRAIRIRIEFWWMDIHISFVFRISKGRYPGRVTDCSTFQNVEHFYFRWRTSRPKLEYPLPQYTIGSGNSCLRSAGLPPPTPLRYDWTKNNNTCRCCKC